MTVCGDESAFEKAVSSPSGSVVYFTASWCGPCRMISPVYEELAGGAGDGTTFLKVDVDDQPEVAAAAGVTAMPTFKFFKDGQLLDTIVGADAAKLQEPDQSAPLLRTAFECIWSGAEPAVRGALAASQRGLPNVSYN